MHVIPKLLVKFLFYYQFSKIIPILSFTFNRVVLFIAALSLCTPVFFKGVSILSNLVQNLIPQSPLQADFLHTGLSLLKGSPTANRQYAKLSELYDQYLRQ